MKISFICPFDLEQYTGTPKRTKTTISVAKRCADISVTSSLKQEKFFPFFKRALQSLKQEKPDIIHAVTTLAIPSAVVFKLFSKWKVKIVFEMHGWGWYEVRKNLIKKTIFLFIDCVGLWLSARVIAMSYSEKKFLTQRVWNAKKIIVLWGPVECDGVYVPPEDNKNFIAGYLGNGSWWQGIHYIIGAAKILAEKRKDIFFTLAGFDFSDQEKYPRLPNVSYLGKISEISVVPTLHAADVLLSPRLKEKVSDLQYPHKLSEYLASGRPVIVSSASDQPFVIEKADCGVVVHDMNAENLAHIILHMADLTKEEREKMGQNAFAFAKKNLSSETFEKKLRDIYSSVRS